MTWPGTPPNQQTPPINPPSMRFPFSLSEKSTMGEVAEAVRTAYNGLTVHEQSFANLPAQIAAQSKTAAETAVTEFVSQETVEGVTSFNSDTGSIIYFPNLGMVNNQLGNPAYTTQNGDAGKKIIAGDSTAVAITLSNGVQLPWFTLIGNDSSASVSLNPGGGAAFYGVNSIYPGGFVIVYFDGSTFWSEGVALATDSTFGVVQPDGVTIGLDSGAVIHTLGASGTIKIPPFTDSGVSGSIFVSSGLITGWVPST